ncbi:YidH family protein [Actinokineospora sp. HUAS TT18]|uniref:YidH family protein n=1 Tax=Actinokineospora sp. HUAS TT18 TaxID=3447451 RepID=UPI003F521E7D
MDKRWPRQVYGEGTEPDARFSLANERTMLAWIRTGLALVAAGVVVDAVDLPVPDSARRWLAAALVLLGALAAAGGWFRWARTERAMRTSRPLPAPTLAAVVVSGLLGAALVVLIVILTR